MPSVSYGIEGQPAPDFDVDTWLNVPAGAARVELADYADVCVYLYAFNPGARVVTATAFLPCSA